ncbi:MAG: sodium:calcium antiporter, partial [Alphaproteobacteria bacterium]|nr:sodium:calcium antiporter [Alphaproteobacteria bacterium]
ANVLLILAVSALLHPIVARPNALRRDGPVLVGTALVFAAIVISGHAGRWLGVALLLALIAYLTLTTLSDRRQTNKTVAGSAVAGGAGIEARSQAVAQNLALVAFGLGAILFGADLLVKGAVDLADRLGVSEAVIGLTMVAIGTSLPELATAIIASIRRQGEIAFGNIIGSNIFNILGIFGATAVVQPIDMPAEVASFDIWVMIGATAALLVFAVTRWQISRWEGAVLLIGYIGYLGLHVVSIGA